MRQKIKKTIALLAISLASITVSSNLYAQVSDKVLVIVNEDVITQSEFDFRMATLRAENAQLGRQLPPNIDKQLLDSMINDRLQLQEAERRGLEVTEEQLDDAIERFASQQNLTVAQLEDSFGNSGRAMELFERSVHDSLVISLLTDYYARSRVFVPEYEIDGEIARNNLGEAATRYQIAHILIKDPDTNRELANSIRDEIIGGLKFEEAAAKYSKAPDAETGGLIGWRNGSQMPEIFLEAVRDARVGDISQVLESPNSLHILKLIDLEGNRTEILQSEVRHILIEADNSIGMKHAAKKLKDIRKRIEAGEDFSQLARIYSDDSGSAATGGSLGWVSPGQMVKPFEDMFSKLTLKEVSEPVETQFGMHIIQVMDRRQENVTERVIRNRVERVLRRQRADREFSQWVRQLKEQAYISYVSEPA